MFRNIQSLRRKNRIIYGLIILLTVCSCVSCTEGSQSADDKIIIACGNDTAGILVKKTVASCTQAEQADIDAQQVGDCCGSNSQFALSTGDVDVAVVCPDAVQFLPEGGKDYMVVGTVVYDANLVVRKTGTSELPASIGYMNNRVNQIETANERITFTYNGNRLRTAELFDKKLDTLTPYQTFYFYYDGTHLSQIEVFIHENAKSKTPRLLQDHWTTYMHETMGVTPLALDMAKNKAEAAKRVVSEVINLTWQGENVSSMYTEDEYSSLKVDYTYDEKNNPLHHFLYTLSGMYASEGVEFVNKNNITKALSTFTLQELDYEEVQQSEVNYLYSYTNDWPVEKQVVKVYGDEEEGYRTTERFVYYYKYSN